MKRGRATHSSWSNSGLVHRTSFHCSIGHGQYRSGSTRNHICTCQGFFFFYNIPKKINAHFRIYLTLSANWSRSAFALVPGGPEQWHRGGLQCFLRREQPVQRNRKHHHQCLYQGLLLWQASGRESWGELSPFLRCDFVHIVAFSHRNHFPPQTEYAQMEGGKYMFRIHRSPMCEYMINFIHKLKHLPEKYMMNSVLENFTILQVHVCLRIFMLEQESLTCMDVRFLESWPSRVVFCPRWCRTERLRRLCSASPSCLKCPQVNMEHSTTYTD